LGVAQEIIATESSFAPGATADRDVLPDLEIATVKAWLADHPEIEIEDGDSA